MLYKHKVVVNGLTVIKASVSVPSFSIYLVFGICLNASTS